MEWGGGACPVLAFEGLNGANGFKDCSLLEKNTIGISDCGILFQKGGK